MKKLVILLTITAMIVSCMAAMGIMASAETSATVGNVSSNRGKEVTFEVTLNESIKAKSGAVTLTFDHAVMQLVTGDDSKTGWTIPSAALATVDPRTEKGAFACMSETEISGTILKVTFLVLDNAPFGKTNVECTIQFRDSSNKDLPVKNVAGSITVVCVHQYDNACDGACNVCGETRTVEHQLKNGYFHDENGHWHECALCGGKTDEGTHTGGSATCVKKAICSVCKTEYGTVDSTKHGKTEVRNDKAATCVENGYTGDTYCKDCGAKISTGTTVPATGVHNWDNGTVTKKMTHTEDGVITYTCTGCGETKTEAVKAVADHVWGDGVETKPATHDEDGEKTYTCEICGETKKEVLPKLTEHVFGDWKNDATNHWKECVCGEKGSVGEHTFGDWTVTKEATETEKGSKEHSCTVCGYKVTEEIPELGKTPSTGDDATVIVSIMVAMGMALAIAVCVRRRKRA